MTSNSPSKSYKRKTGRQAGREAGKKEGRDKGKKEGEKTVGRKKKTNCKFSSNFYMAFDVSIVNMNSDGLHGGESLSSTSSLRSVTV